MAVRGGPGQPTMVVVVVVVVVVTAVVVVVVVVGGGTSEARACVQRLVVPTTKMRGP